MHVHKDRTDELGWCLIAKDFVIKNNQRLRFFGNLEWNCLINKKIVLFKFVVNVFMFSLGRRAINTYNIRGYVAILHASN